MSPWVPVIITAGLGLGSIAVQLIFAGRWVGRVTAEMKTQHDDLKRVGDAADERFRKVTETLEKVDGRLDGLGDEIADEASRRSGFEHRLGQVEEAAKVMWDVRDKLTEMRTANEVHEQYRREKWDRLERQVDGMARQLGTIASKGLEYRPGESTA